MKRFRFLALILILCLLAGCSAPNSPTTEEKAQAQETLTLPQTEITDTDELALLKFDASPYAVINSNKPFFTEDELTAVAFESYAELDALGRCGTALSSVGREIMPTEDRGSIGQVKPSGWQTVKYDIVDGKYLYNRCHLIGFQLTGENANTKNLITGTRYMNVEGMLPFENMIADFVKESGFHVMYRVTPVFYGDELVARGVLLEAMSVEDKGEGILFCVYCFNAQPGIEIDYATGDSRLGKMPEGSNSSQAVEYVLNTNSKKIHKKSCSSASDIAPKNRKETTESLDKLLSDGYETCKLCF